MDKLKEQYLSWHDLTLWIWAALTGVVYSVIRFLKWFFLREMENFITKLHDKTASQILKAEKRLENRINDAEEKTGEKFKEIEKHLINYKKNKHDLADINAGYEGAMPTILEALKSAQSILNNDKEGN